MSESVLDLFDKPLESSVHQLVTYILGCDGTYFVLIEQDHQFRVYIQPKKYDGTLQLAPRGSYYFDGCNKLNVDVRYDPYDLEFMFIPKHGKFVMVFDCAYHHKFNSLHNQKFKQVSLEKAFQEMTCMNEQRVKFGWKSSEVCAMPEMPESSASSLNDAYRQFKWMRKPLPRIFHGSELRK